MGRQRPIALAIAGAGVIISLAVQSPALPPDRAQAAPAQDSQPNQLVGVTLAKGIKASGLFAQGEVTPIGPTSSFINTDLPYAIVRVKRLVSETVVTLRVSDPIEPAFSVETKAPRHKDNLWEGFDFALPLYILGTDLESRTGTWTIQVLFNGQSETTTPFQWDPATPLALGKIKDLIDLSPTDADLHWRYGAALALLHHDREGIEELQHAIELDSRYALYYITLGRVYEREGQTADAIRMFRTALSLHGSHYDAVYAGWAQAHLARLQTH